MQGWYNINCKGDVIKIKNLNKTLSIRLTQKEIDDLSKLSANKMMKKGQFIRYLINKEMENKIYEQKKI